jgi:hypothetical protein
MNVETNKIIVSDTMAVSTMSDTIAVSTMSDIFM